MYGLIFDVDGVVGNTEPINAQATSEVLSEMFGITGVQPKDFDAGLGRGAYAYVQAGAAAHGHSLTDKQTRKAVPVRGERILHLIRTQGLGSIPGVLELMKQAQDDPQFRVAIASSAERELVEAILNAVSAPREKLIEVTGDDVTRKKPDPEIFLIAAEKIAMAPRHCVVVEDAPDGVAAAKAAGAKCIAITSSVGAELLSDADLVVSNLQGIDVAKLISLINDG